jgi:hypothetical protein
MKHLKLFEEYDSNYSKQIMSDLYDVGIKKALGYLPIRTISKYGNDTVENVINWAKENGKSYQIFTEDEGSTSSGSLYVYDVDMLKNMLYLYKEELIKASIPLDPHAYVDYIEKNLVLQQEFPKAYEIIGKTFNDKRFS